VAVETEPVYGSASISGDSYPIVIGGSSSNGGQVDTKTGLEYKNDRYNTAGKLKTTILADVEIPDDVPMELTLRGDPLFSGTIRIAHEGVTDRVRLEAYDAAADLKRNNLTASYDRASIETIAEDALDKAGVAGAFDLPTIRVSPEFDGKRCDKVLEKVARWGDAAWFVDARNVVNVTASIASATNSYQLEWVKDASPGKRTPAYQSVRVTGSSAVSRRGLGYRYLISSRPIVATAGSGSPVYEYHDNDIQTKEQAQNVADQILKKLKEQQKGGWVETVGHEEIRPFDTVELPAHLGGEEYLVRGVEQTIDSRNGFVTRLELGGLIEP